MARVTLHMPDEVHQLWRHNYRWINLSQVLTNALLDLVEKNGKGEDQVVRLCDLCRRRVAATLAEPAPPSRSKPA